MSFSLVYTAHYKKLEIKFLKSHPELTEKYRKILALLHEDPWHPALRWHRLRGTHKHLDAVSITISYRITLEMKIVQHEIILIAVGSHDEVY